VEGREGDGKNDLTHPLSQIPGYATDVYIGLHCRRKREWVFFYLNTVYVCMI